VLEIKYPGRAHLPSEVLEIGAGTERTTGPVIIT
jgi:hypothetical protein